MDQEFPSRYDASTTEQKWYLAWEAAGLFQPETDSSKEKFVITIPPPNITGSLHMGHALCYSIQDLVGRYQRLRGKNVLILPGQDHAGIATQSVVIKQLKKEGKNASEMGREAFVERVWEWRKESGDTIIRQFRRLGHAFDWTRTRFTLDPEYAQAVLKVFVDWFDRGLIYRGWRVVNWDPVLKTSVSDIETERKIIKGKLYFIRYPFVDGSGEVVIATTRPETMLADVAVAVHPSDQRYKDKVGKLLRLPLVGREIPLISDIYPDPEFGSGAVKITPAHDPNDYEVGVRHNLDMPVVLDESARINELGGEYKGLDRIEARKRIVADLEASGFLVEIKDHEIPVMVSERSGEIVEPLLREEWFAKQTELAQPAIDAVRSGKVTFVPERYQKIFLDWMENVRDWNVSRRLWWGHRIPVYYSEEGSAVAAMSWEDAESKLGKKIVSQDEYVLDTWFSSGLWPFATLGWPKETEDLKSFYPTSLLVTAQEILYLWVARMIMMGLDCAGDIPFSQVYIYATVLTEDGKRMSKSLGTGVDPIEVIDAVGADALRFTLLSQTGYNQDIRYSERRTEDARNFCNKIWNAVRFVTLNASEPPNRPTKLEEIDSWLLTRLAATEEAVRTAYDSYDNQAAAHALYRFFWSELCDWYIEVAKPRLSSEKDRETPQWVLLTCIEAFLKMMHPIMPHITEEVYSRLPIADKSEFLMQSKWPEIDTSLINQSAVNHIERAFHITRELRALRAEVGLAALKPVEVAYVEGDVQGVESILKSQAWIQELRPGKPVGKFISATTEGIDVHLPLGPDFNLDKELTRLAKDEERTTADIKRISARLSNPAFVEKANPDVIAKDEAHLLELQRKLEKIGERRQLFQS
ncbi:MAG TPA: valine--tRNA ligase [Fimbriimonadaceae bacterium]|nr:valine--tRNA ligase [Fimbriimonadaceae bacterium]